MVSRTGSDRGRVARERRPLRGPFSRWPRTADTGLAAALFFVILTVSFNEPNGDFAVRVIGDIPIGEYFLVAGACGALLRRRVQPLTVLAVTLAATVLATPFGYPEVVEFAMLVALYSVGRYATGDRSSYIASGVAIAVITAENLVRGVPADDFASGLLVLSGGWYIGRRVRIRGAYMRLLHERAEQRERDQAAVALQAVAEERTRIARELHDVVAHRVSMMTVQAGAAKTVAADDPDGAYRAMEAVEQAGRQALGELRHLLGVLRPGPATRPRPPLGLAEIPRLIDQTREAGMEVTLTTNGVPKNLPAQVDLSAYRIVQEALTNAVKHAGPQARTQVRLTYQDGTLIVDVADDGEGNTILQGSGHGIIGMRERAALLGGDLEVGPCIDGGFRVLARLPLGKRPA